MVALLFTATFIIGLLAIALYFWAPRAKNPEQDLLPPSEALRGLFSDEQHTESAALPAGSREREAGRLSLRERARTGDKSVLNEAHALRDEQFYNQLLDEFTTVADGAPALLSLVSYVTRNELPINRKLAEAVITSWRNSPDRNSTATTLHLTALADDADLFRSTVEAALSFWQQGLLANVSAAELRALFDGEFWVLSAQSRNSGAGFILKRTLANARRELETAMRVN
ncbi:MAG TPA: hypothetical protein VMZ30_07290 [Pyrinomonadaceae bacterium]|nr:hypothetical protein [Pyrinomonadaceae bacterium]